MTSSLALTVEEKTPTDQHAFCQYIEKTSHHTLSCAGETGLLQVQP